MFNQSTIDRFWAKVDRSGGPDACWLWLGGRKAAGYGNFFVRRETPGQHGRMIFANAHKFAYELIYGAVPSGQVVRHTCDNPPCCNPAHLIAGTPADNVQDAIARGRVDYRVLGQESADAMRRATRARRRLSEQDLAAIVIARSDGRSLNDIASDYGLVDGSLANIFKGASYRDIPLARYLATLYQQGIRFPYPGPTPIPAPLQALADVLRKTGPDTMNDAWLWDDARNRALIALDRVSPEDAMEILKRVFDEPDEKVIAPTLVGMVIGTAQRQDDRQRAIRSHQKPQERRNRG